MNLISQTWSYAGIPFAAGRPELVGTAPEYRRRGLVRAQFRVVHEMSAERKELVQGITGIPDYYRQFGYEMALNLGGGRRIYRDAVPGLRSGEVEAYRFRPPAEEDVPFVVALEAHARRRSLLACQRDAALWRYELFGRRANSTERFDWRIIETTDGQPLGLFGYNTRSEEGRLGAPYLELRPGVSWLALVPALLRFLNSAAEACEQREGKPCRLLSFWPGPDHPLFQAAPERLSVVRRPYAWYLRVPDLPAFVRHIAPALEERLAASVAVGYSGELKLSFHRTGLRLLWEEGRLRGVEPWQPQRGDEGAAGFPGLTFLQILFGYRALDELQSAFADCWVQDDEPRVLLNALFPKQPSQILPMG
jgi:hypothetical protein